MAFHLNSFFIYIYICADIDMLRYCFVGHVYLNVFIVVPLYVRRAGPRHVGPPAWLMIWRPLEPILFKLFRSETGLAKLFEGA